MSWLVALDAHAQKISALVQLGLLVVTGCSVMLSFWIVLSEPKRWRRQKRTEERSQAAKKCIFVGREFIRALRACIWWHQKRAQGGVFARRETERKADPIVARSPNLQDLDDEIVRAGLLPGLDECVLLEEFLFPSGDRPLQSLRGIFNEMNLVFRECVEDTACGPFAPHRRGLLTRMGKTQDTLSKELDSLGNQLISKYGPSMQFAEREQPESIFTSSSK